MVWWDISIDRHVPLMLISYRISIYRSYQAVCCDTMNLKETFYYDPKNNQLRILQIESQSDPQIQQKEKIISS